MSARKHRKKFEQAIRQINREFSSSIATEFLVTLGDEFQGLLNSAKESYRLVRRFQDLMGEIPFAFGIGIGTLSTPLKSKGLGMDGDCFYRSRDAIIRAKKEKQEIIYNFADHVSCDLVNTIIWLLEQEWKRITPRQRIIMQLLKVHEPNKIAKLLKISPQAISKTKKRISFVKMQKVEESFHSFLTTLS